MKKWLIEKYLKDWKYEIDLSTLEELHKNTSKDDLITMIVQLMDRYAYLLKHQKPMF